jgi:siroheme synthase
MGLGRSGAIATSLVLRGWNGSTPAAVVAGATTDGQYVWRGTLSDLAADRVEVPGSAAGTIVVGDVVALELASPSCVGAELAPPVAPSFVGAELARPVEGNRPEREKKHVSRG